MSKKFSVIIKNNIRKFNKNISIIPGCKSTSFRALIFSSQTIGISHQHTNANFSKDICNGLVEIYMDYDLEKKQLSSAKVVKFINIQKDSVKKRLIDSEKKIQEEMIKDSGKPSNVMEKILEGKMKKFYSEITLLNQNFVIDTDKTVKEAISDFNTSNSLILKNYILISL